MEYLQVFDEKGNAIEEKVARDMKYELPEGKFFMIVLIFMENNKGEFLLQKTSESRHSCIATTGGHVAFGDDGLSTAIREVKEELGIDLDKKELQYVDTLIYKNCYLKTYYLKKDIDIASLTIQEEEVAYVKYFTVEEINKFIEDKEFREGNIVPFKKVLEYRS